MTAGAKSLTKSASFASQVRPSSWATMPMADLRTFANGCENLGHDVDALLADRGLSRRDLNDPDRRIACDVMGSLIARAQQKRFTSNLGLAMALATPLGAYPLLDYLVLTSDTVGDGPGAARQGHRKWLPRGPALRRLRECATVGSANSRSPPTFRERSEE